MKWKSFSSSTRPKQWAKGFGLIGFLFFLAKGIAWLVVPILIALKARQS